MKPSLAALLLLTACWLPVGATAEDLKPICPDRPGRGTSACTVEEGHAQLELGLFDESAQRRSGVTTDADIVGSVLAKWGIGDRADIEAGMALYQFQRVQDTARTATSGGIGDLLLHAKYNVLATGPENEPRAFALVLDPFVKLPTAGGGLGNGAVEAGLVLPMAYDLGNDWSVAMT